MENIAKLCRCTQILLARKNTNTYIEEFEKMYNRYNETSKGLFNDSRVLPNHHYALHVPEQMRYWGPLMAVSEFPGERVNGILQNVKTNHRTGQSGGWFDAGVYVLIKLSFGILAEMDGTIMTRTCQLQRFLADYPPPIENSGINKGKNTRRIILHDAIYKLLLKHLKVKMPGIRGYYDVSHPEDSIVLNQYASPAQNHRIRKGTDDFLISPLAPNNCICYVRSGRRRYAMIQQIYTFSGPSGGQQWGVLVKPVHNRFGKDLQAASKNFRWMLYLLRSVVGEIGDETFFLSPEDITM